jgi:CMP-N,N'-diacetyllegionaminic acid synthase
MTHAGLHVVCIIPARGGSMRIPSKNLIPIAGMPLIAHSIRHALGAHSVSETWVSTDDAQIAAVARKEGAEVAMRPAEISGATAPSESALAHTLEVRRQRGDQDPDLVVFLQCTSPIRRRDDIDKAVAMLVSQRADSLFSGCENTALIWRLGAAGPVSINYDYQRRRREQDMDPQVRENGSIYVFRPSILRQHQNRLGGRITVYEMDYWSSFQIDTPEHVELCEWILGQPEFSHR